MSRALLVSAHLLLLVAAPPLLLGVVARVKSWFSGRRGPPVLQPYRDLLRLLRKGATLSPTTTVLFRLGPAVSLVAALLVGFLLPLAGGAPLSFAGDFVLFAYLLAAGRLMTVLAALDTGSSFEGMGASREVTFAALAEPALFLGFGVLFRATGELSLDAALGEPLAAAWSARTLPLALVLVSVFLMFLAENCRIPVDDPTTHLELTMVHEVMVLDHSGPDFAFVLYGAAVKFAVLGLFFVDLLLPAAVPAAGAGAMLFLRCAGLLALAALVGVVESVMARLRMDRVPAYLAAAVAFPSIGLALTFA